MRRSINSPQKGTRINSPQNRTRISSPQKRREEGKDCNLRADCVQAWMNTQPPDVYREFQQNFRRLTKANKWMEDPELEDSILACMGFVSCGDQEPLFQQGEKPERCYLLLAGEAHFYSVGELNPTSIDTHFRADEDDPRVRKASLRMAAMLDESMGDTNVRVFEEVLRKADAKEKRKDVIGSLGDYKESVGVGVLFGDLAMLEENPRRQVRKFSAVCSGPCVLLYIQKADFDIHFRSIALKHRRLDLGNCAKPLLSQFSFFRALSMEEQDALPEILHYSQGKKGDVIFRQGDKPGNCYLIISGEVSIWKEDAEQVQLEVEVAPDVRKVQDAPADHFAEGLSMADKFIEILKDEAAEALSRPAPAPAPPATAESLPDDSAAPAAEPTEGSPKRRPRSSRVRIQDEWGGLGCFEGVTRREVLDGVQIALLQPGSVLGMQALQSDDVRNAGATCSEDTEVLTISKEDYVRLLKETSKHTVNIEVAVQPLIQALPFFQRLNPKALANLPYIMKSVQFQAGSVLFRQGDVPGGCYIVLAGKVSIWTTSLDYDRGASTRLAKEKVHPEVVKCCENLITLLGDQENERSDRSRRSLLGRMSSRRTSRIMLGSLVTTLEAGKVFGRRGTCAESQQFAASCAEDCIFLFIEKDDFDMMLRNELISDQMYIYGNQIRRFLGEFSFYERISKAVQDQMLKMVKYTTRRAGGIMFREGDAPGPCFIILSGQARVWKKMVCECGELALDPERLCPKCGNVRPKKPLDCTCGSTLMPGSLYCRLCGSDCPGEFTEDLVSCSVIGCNWTGPESKLKQHRIDHINVRRNVFFDDKAGRTDILRLKFIHRRFSSSKDHDAPEAQLAADNEPTLKDIIALLRMFPLGAEIVCRTKKVDPFLLEQDPELYKWEEELERSRAVCIKNSLLQLGVVEEQLGILYEDGQDGDESALYLKHFLGIESEQVAAIYERPSSLALQKCHTIERLLAEQGDHNRYCNCGTMLSQDANYCSQCGLKAPDAFVNDLYGVVQKRVDSISFPMADLGPGSVFGYKSMFGDIPRACSVTCSTDCEFLYIERARVAEVQKQELKDKQESTKRKLESLHLYMPVMLKIPTAAGLRFAEYFEEHEFPLHHTFFAQGRRGEGSYYFILQGSVELLFRGEPPTFENSLVRGSGLRRLGVLQKGSLFSSSSPKSTEDCTAAVTSAPCRVLRLPRGHFKYLPEQVLKAMKQLDEQSISWRLSRVSSTAAFMNTYEFGVGGTLERPNTSVNNPAIGLRRPWDGRTSLLSGKMPRLSTSPSSPKAQKPRLSLGASISLPALT